MLLGLGGAVAVAAGAVAIGLAGGDPPDPRDTPIACTPQELAIVRAIVEAVLPADGDLPSGSALGVVQRIDEELWSTTPETRADLKSALAVLQWWPVLSGFGGRLTRLPPEVRAAALDHAAVKGPRPVAQAATAFKQMCHLFAYTADGTWAAIGYDGPWVRTPKPPPSSRAYRAMLEARRATG